MSQEKNSSKGEESPVSDFGLRLKQAFDNAKNAEIARKIGVSAQAIGMYMEGRMPNADVLIKIKESSRVDLNWLLTGNGENKTIPLRINSQYSSDDDSVIPVRLEQHIEEKLAELAKEEFESVENIAANLIIESLIARGIVTDKVEGMQLQFFGDIEIKLVPIPLLGTIAAGKPIMVFEYEETVLVAEEFVIPGRDTYALRVKGDSMTDQGILDNDLIIVTRTNIANPGETVVALIDGEKATVKKFYRRGNQIVLRPASAKHKDIVIDAHRVEIQGTVTGLQRRT